MLILAVLTAVLVMSGRPVEQRVAFPRLATRRNSGECILVPPEAILRGSMRGRSADDHASTMDAAAFAAGAGLDDNTASLATPLSDVGTALRYHARAGGHRSLCAQHLDGAPPLCYCVYLPQNASSYGRYGPPDSAYQDFFNMHIRRMSLDDDMWSEHNVFCGDQTVKRANAVHAVWLERGHLDQSQVVRPFEARFENSDSVHIQMIDEVQHAADVCAADSVARFRNHIDLRMARQQAREFEHPGTMFQLSQGQSYRALPQSSRPPKQ